MMFTILMLFLNIKSYNCQVSFFYTIPLTLDNIQLLSPLSQKIYISLQYIFRVFIFCKTFLVFLKPKTDPMQILLLTATFPQVGRCQMQLPSQTVTRVALKTVFFQQKCSTVSKILSQKTDTRIYILKTKKKFQTSWWSIVQV